MSKKCRLKETFLSVFLHHLQHKDKEGDVLPEIDDKQAGLPILELVYLMDSCICTSLSLPEKRIFSYFNFFLP